VSGADAAPGTPNLAALVEVIGRALADEPERVRGTEGQHRGIAVVELFMAPGDIGRVIGRQGRTAQAVRGLVSLAAEKTGGKAQVEFRESR
jgi:predicted RNA-binding protein YlqC (UPF0109 family)